jgi:hypothetical protein
MAREARKLASKAALAENGLADEFRYGEYGAGT